MHSSVLRGSEFEIVVDGQTVPHDEYFCGFTKTTRLGLVAPNRVDGAGAINLIMAYVTAFYDDYRAEGGEFYAYPDFFAFQKQKPLANYSMFDVSPGHKLVCIDSDPTQALAVINDRAINVLLVPDVEPGGRHFDKIPLASARRNIDQCYVYAFEGNVKDADVMIRCARSPFDDWVGAMFDTLGDEASIKQCRAAWFDQIPGDHLEQSFRRVSLDEALARL